MKLVEAEVVVVDNGYPAGLDSFKANSCKVYNGKRVAIIQSKGEEENIQLEASNENSSATINIKEE